MTYKSPEQQRFEDVASRTPAGPAMAMKQLHEQLAPPAGTTGGHFEFDPAEVGELLKKAEAARDRFRKLMRDADRQARNIRPPAQDYASVAQAEAAKKHFGVSFAQAAQQQYEYADALCQAIRAAIGEKDSTEDATADEMRQQGAGLE